MLQTVGKALLGLAVMAVCFWATLTILDHFGGEHPAAATTTSAETEPSPSLAPSWKGWNETLYLAVNPDVAAAIARNPFRPVSIMNWRGLPRGGRVPQSRVIGSSWIPEGPTGRGRGRGRGPLHQRLSPLSCGRSCGGAPRRISVVAAPTSSATSRLPRARRRQYRRYCVPSSPSFFTSEPHFSCSHLM